MCMTIPQSLRDSSLCTREPFYCLPSYENPTKMQRIFVGCRKRAFFMSSRTWNVVKWRDPLVSDRGRRGIPHTGARGVRRVTSPRLCPCAVLATYFPPSAKNISPISVKGLTADTRYCIIGMTMSYCARKKGVCDKVKIQFQGGCL